MFEILMKMYIEGKLTDEQLDKALAKGWITEEQFNDIREAKINALEICK